MKIAVTGASGFIGSHVLNALARHDEVEVIAVSRRTVPSERLPARMRQLSLDVEATAKGDYERLGRPDMLIHLAWGGLPNYQSSAHFEHELPAQHQFLRNLVEAGLPSLLVTGTCYEYGMADGELREDRSAAPVTAYAQAKVELHERLDALRSRFPFALTWARLFYMWGPGQAPGSLFPLLRAAIERGDTSFAMSKGDQLRDYLPVEEVARILVALALRREGFGTVNICSGKPIAIKALVEQWLRDHEWQIALDLGKYPYPTYEPFAFWGSTAKLDRLLAGPRPRG